METIISTLNKSEYDLKDALNKISEFFYVCKEANKQIAAYLDKESLFLKYYENHLLGFINKKGLLIRLDSSLLKKTL